MKESLETHEENGRQLADYRIKMTQVRAWHNL